MTGSMHPSDGAGGRTPSASSEGLILQRGGEELALEKVGDRFTLRLAEGRSLTPLLQRLEPEQVNPVLSVDLVEIQVAPDRMEAAMQAARDNEAVTFASHVYQLKENASSLFYLTDQLTVQFSPGVTAQTAKTIVDTLGLQAVEAVDGVPQTFVFRVTQQATANPVKLANQLMHYPEVLTAEPNIVSKVQPHYRPRDPEYPRQWYLNHKGGTDLVLGSDIAAEAAWDITRGSRSIVVAIADDGFDLNHPDFQGKGKIVAPRDLKDLEFLPLPGSETENHGTACAGIAIAEENGVGMVGIAPGCALMPIRTTGFLDDTAVEQIFHWAVTQGASVISCSWGPSAVYFPLSLRQRAAIGRATTQGRNGKGCVVVFAAGNANRPVNGSVYEQGWGNEVLKGPTSWLNGFTVHPDVITVAATTSLNQKAAYSNWGDEITIAAPSNNALPGVWLPQSGYVNTAPQIKTNLKGRSILTTDRVGNAGYDAGNYTEQFGGTSSACPLVAGVAALVLSANPNLTAKEVQQILQETADKVVDPASDPQLGLKKGSYDATGHSSWFGFGKVNAFKAVQAAQRRSPQSQTPTRWIRQQNTTPVDIPDNDLQGSRSSIQVNDSAPIREVQLTIDLEHSYLGDLEIKLIPPQGEPILLQNRTLGRRTQLQTTYSLQTTPTLRRLLNQPSTGRWQLHLVDHAQFHTGRLKSWQIALGV